MSGDFMDSFLAARTMSNTGAIADELQNVSSELRKIRQGTVSIDKYNQLVRDYNCDTAHYIAQRDEAMTIIKENIETLPFTYDDACERVDAKGEEAEQAKKAEMDAHQTK